MHAGAKKANGECGQRSCGKNSNNNYDNAIKNKRHSYKHAHLVLKSFFLSILQRICDPPSFRYFFFFEISIFFSLKNINSKFSKMLSYGKYDERIAKCNFNADFSRKTQLINDTFPPFNEIRIMCLVRVYPLANPVSDSILV